MRRLIWATLLAAGCHAAPTVPPRPKAEVAAAAPPPDTLEQIREEVAGTSKGRAPTQAECAEWVARLKALWIRDPAGYAAARLDAAQIEQACGNPERATALLKEATRKAPPWAQAEARTELAWMHFEAGRYEDAERSIVLALLAAPGNQRAMIVQARLWAERYGRNGELEALRAAEASYEQLAAAGVDDAVVRLGRARLLVLRAARDPTVHNEARVALEFAASLAEGRDAAEVLFLHGLLATEAGDDNTALRCFRHATELDPMHTEAWAELGLISVRFRDWAGGLEAISKAQADARFEEHRGLLRARGSALVQLKYFRKAELTYERLASLEPGDPINEWDLANLAEVQASTSEDPYIAELHLADAARHFRAFLRTAPESLAAPRTHAREFLVAYADPE